ncbi:MAG: ZIP family metal transporter [Firmicutes bacterium]|nr:ZIP family metal transporter [Bacillota bacterium]
MSNNTAILVSMFLPLLGTSLGAATVFFFRGEMNSRLQKALLGFAAGVMIAASVWSLLIPAMEMAEQSGLPAWLPAVGGFLAGIFFLLLLDSTVPHIHINSDEPEGRPAKGLGKSLMLMLAVTLHNLPEGMAVGVVLAGLLSGSDIITVAAAFSLTLGIAIQNFPEGAIISAPLVSNGMSKGRACLYGVLSGVVEPLGVLIMLLLSRWLAPVLPYILAFSAGAMMYVVIEELIPESQNGEHSNIGTIGAALGFALMMLLDVAIG